MTSDELYLEFLKVAKTLNHRLGIEPVLFGSLGLRIITQAEMAVHDIVIPQKETSGIHLG